MSLSLPSAAFFRRLLLLWLSTSIPTAVSSPPWSPSETADSFVLYPPELSELMEREFNQLYKSPVIHIFNTLPEPSSLRLWPLIKALTVRNHQQNFVLWSHPVYYLIPGSNVGCVENSTADSWCQDHCTHGGRYCYDPEAALENNNATLSPQIKGKDVLLEILRRLCFDQFYEASDYEFFDYLERFDRADCWASGSDQSSLASCSMEVLNDLPKANYLLLDYCVGDPESDDMQHELLEGQLQDFQSYNLSLTDLPVLTFGDIVYDGEEYTVDAIFEFYCNFFRTDDSALENFDMVPLACDICEPCADVQTCLWTLECDGVPFNGTEFAVTYPGITSVSKRTIDTDD
ncbi:expressed unknown protein [Seminavis robusta]|uniref:Vacuolar sorting receptor thioredoxin-like domain-containing protein n=1 Tax=Seminavis robusta TaxID=568900 RepID=A0A9N8EET9_9STRA|nr:expressed unknown protein [Seminavis robusta]|eukprot:Sro1077_g238670.1 n/a (346) ;mRNA; r:27756-28793